MVFWITGLSGAGKSTLARNWCAYLREHHGCLPILLDGDEIRAVVADPAAGHDRPGRLRNAFRLARLAHLLESQGHTVVVATMSLFHEIHDWNRRELKGYLEVLLQVSPEVLARRHQQNLYDGSHSNVVGLDLPAEEPKQPHLILDNDLERHDFAPLLAEIEAAWQVMTP